MEMLTYIIYYKIVKLTIIVVLQFEVGVAVKANFFFLTDVKANYNNLKYLVEAEDLEDSLDKLREYFKSKSYSEEEWFFFKVEETNIEEVII